MILDSNAYPIYKYSGVPWMGDVPKHWEVRRLRNAVYMRVSNVDKHTKEGELPIRLCNYVDVYKNERITERVRFMRATATSEEVARFRLEHDDVLITKDSESWNDIGVPALVEHAAPDLVCGYHLALLRPFREVMNGSYLLRTMQSPAVAYQFHVEANGVTRYGLSHAAIKSIWLPLPPLPEQAAIVRFVDHADRRIRRYIRAKQKLIKLLEEQKQTIIHRAVTRGLDPNVRLKPSAVEWLGDVPEHWEVKRVQSVFGERNHKGNPDLPILVVSIAKGVTIGSEIDEDGRPKRLIEDRSQYKIARKGDIAYNMMRMWQGAVGVAPVDGLVSPAYVVAHPLNEVNANYYAMLFRTRACKGDIVSRSRGIVDDRNRLYWDGFKDVRVPVPPCHEQNRIVDTLAEQTRAVAKSIDAIDREISLLREYRTRLIYDVVTGKLDVREAAARLPDEPAASEQLDESEALAEGEESGDDADPGAAPEEAEA